MDSPVPKVQPGDGAAGRSRAPLLVLLPPELVSRLAEDTREGVGHGGVELLDLVEVSHDLFPQADEVVAVSQRSVLEALHVDDVLAGH